MADETKVVRHGDGGRIVAPPKSPEPKKDAPDSRRVDRQG